MKNVAKIQNQISRKVAKEKVTQHVFIIQQRGREMNSNFFSYLVF